MFAKPGKEGAAKSSQVSIAGNAKCAFTVLFIRTHVSITELLNKCGRKLQKYIKRAVACKEDI